jgi:hypothetical protein
MNYYAFLVREHRAGRVPPHVWLKALTDEVFRRFLKKHA